MKKSKLFCGILVISFFAACNNQPGKTAADNNEKIADSLFKEVMHGHDIGMAKSMAIEKAIGITQKAIDSLNSLSATAKQNAAPYKQQLDSLLKDLNYASFSMDKWMGEMNWEPSKIEINERIKYLTAEKLKVEKVKEAILGSLAKADSLLKAKL